VQREVTESCLEEYSYPPTIEYLQELSAAQPSDRLDWRFFAGLGLIGVGVFLYRKR
jgi:hypothetical protein